MIQRERWLSTLLNLVLILAALLVILASLAILWVIFAILGKFSQTILLFVMGAILAYLLAPLVNSTQKILRVRWLAVLIVYLAVISAFVIVGTLLFTPFVQQSQSLVSTLQKPAAGSLQLVSRVQNDAGRIHQQLRDQQSAMSPRTTVPASQVETVQTEINALQRDVPALKKAREVMKPPAHTSRGLLTTGTVQTQIPPSYVDPIARATQSLAADYAAATATPGSVDTARLRRAVGDAAQASTAAGHTYQVVSSSPILILRLQGWMDNHGIKVDLQQNFGQAIQQLNTQAATILNQAVNILLKVGNLLLNCVLTLIISVYLLSDGGRLIRRGIAAVPAQHRDEAWFFVRSVDRVLSGYLRGQIILAGLAGVLGGLGSWVLGVPYPVLIGISTFVLQLIPVIGPLILLFPPVAIALIFTPMPGPIIVFVYFEVLEQLITNIIGPRITSSSVGIHPLEAMAAALIGYPLAGFLGSFFAVPAVGLIHIILGQAQKQRREGMPGDEGSDERPAPQARTASG